MGVDIKGWFKKPSTAENVRDAAQLRKEQERGQKKENERTVEQLALKRARTSLISEKADHPSTPMNFLERKRYQDSFGAERYAFRHEVVQHLLINAKMYQVDSEEEMKILDSEFGGDIAKWADSRIPRGYKEPFNAEAFLKVVASIRVPDALLK